MYVRLLISFRSRGFVFNFPRCTRPGNAAYTGTAVVFTIKYYYTAPTAGKTRNTKTDENCTDNKNDWPRWIRRKNM